MPLERVNELNYDNILVFVIFSLPKKWIPYLSMPGKCMCETPYLFRLPYHLGTLNWAIIMQSNVSTTKQEHRLLCPLPFTNIYQSSRRSQKGHLGQCQTCLKFLYGEHPCRSMNQSLQFVKFYCADKVSGRTDGWTIGQTKPKLRFLDLITILW